MTDIRDDLPTLGTLAIDVLPSLEVHGLRRGCHLYAFRSGGGCRVVRMVRMERDKGLVSQLHADLLRHEHVRFGLVGYGDDCNVEPALIACAANLLGGADRDPPYWTGSSEPTSKLDHWLLQGATFDAFSHENLIAFELHGWGRYIVPTDLMARVIATGNPEEHEQRGFCYRVSLFIFPGNGELGVSSHTIYRPPGKGKLADSMWQFTKTGIGASLHEAIEAAFAAPEVEDDG